MAKPHAVCIPYPYQGHINAMLQLAKLLHSRAFHVTFVHTDFNYNRILLTSGPSALQGLPDFRFQAFRDGLQTAGPTAPPAPTELVFAVRNSWSGPVRDLVEKLNRPDSGGPAVTCIVSDVIMSFCVGVAEELGVPGLLFNSFSARAYMGSLQTEKLIERGLIPLKSESDLTNGYLETPLDWIPGMRNMRLKHLSPLIRTTDRNQVFLNFLIDEMRGSLRATAIILNTSDDLEGEVIEAMSAFLPPLYSVGPLSKFCSLALDGPEKSIGSSLWEEDSGCLNWLQGKRDRSVVYVNFGSLAVMSSQQLIEFAWGIADSGYDFLWVIRDNIVIGESAILPEEFRVETSGRGLMTGWCPQEEVLMHPSVGGFLTHCGWNSVMESVSAGVPMICWPVAGDQRANCLCVCSDWKIGVELVGDAKREEVAAAIGEVMGAESGREMRTNALRRKESATKAVERGGSSYENFERLIKKVLLVHN